MSDLTTWVVVTREGNREWQAEDAAHAIEQHEDAFPDEEVLATHLPAFTLGDVS